MSAHEDESQHQAAAVLTLRDYFAAKAMQGICAGRDEAGELIEHGYEWVAREAFRIAAAMLKERAS
jgi:hypothetical protein